MRYQLFPELDRPTREMSLAEIRRALSIDAKIGRREAANAETKKLPKVRVRVEVSGA